MKSYNSVRVAVAGMELHPDYVEKIDQFRRDYLVLQGQPYRFVIFDLA